MDDAGGTGVRPRAVGVNHVALVVGDIGEALDFYGAIFEFTLQLGLVNLWPRPIQQPAPPHELTMKNIELFGREVLPHLRDIWTDEWDNHWWPERLRGQRKIATRAAAR